MYGKFCFFILIACLMKDTRSYIIKGSRHCYSDNKNPYPYTGTKTPYSYVHGTRENMKLPNCEPRQIWLLCRHGTRYPNIHRILQMLNLTYFRDRVMENHRLGSGNLCEKDLLYLKNWKPDPELHPSRAKDLVPQGKKDMETLGERLKEKLPTLFQHAIENYEFRSTNSQRTIDSMWSFIDGAFGNKINVTFKIVPTSKDTLLKTYKTCKPWKNMTANEQKKEFTNSPKMTKVIVDVSRRLGFVDEEIKKKDIFSIYNACRFERAWYPDKLSPWCVAFTDDEMRVIEYRGDLNNYYRFGPGSKINSQLGCRPLQDMFDRFTKLEKGRDGPKGVFYFTHYEMLLLFFTAMGIGEDTTWNYQDMQRRNWRSSLLTPFAANFAAVFHSCKQSKTPFKIAFYLSENPLTLEGCENGVCDWEWIKKKFGDIATNCNLKVCERNQ